jgi:hypothetical protein
MVRSFAAALLLSATLAPVALAQKPPAKAPDAGLNMGQAIQQFDPAANHFIWALPPGVHGAGPWEINVEVKHKGEVTYKTSIALKAEIIKPGDHFQPPAGYEAIRLSDAGEWKPKMAEVQKQIDAVIAKYGHGDGELVLQNGVHTTLDATGKKLYCTEKKAPELRLMFEETAKKKITMVEPGSMKMIADKAILNHCAS